MMRGAYLPRASGSMAFVPRRAGVGQYDWSEAVLLHEYAHHLMLHESDSAYPEWLVEGFAEFMSTARMEKDGSVLLGVAPQHRARGLLSGNPLPIEALVSGNYGKLSNAQREALYGRGWLLAHYLTFEPSRRGQLERYVDAVTKGTPPLAAAVSAFGDLKQLEKETEAYLRRPRLTSLQVAPQALTISPIEVAPLSAGPAAVMPLRIESKRGVNRMTAAPLAQKVRELAAAHPNDPLVLVTLAEAEFDAGNYDAALAAADRAIAAAPRNTEAMVYKGRAMVRLAERSSADRKQRFAQARELFIAANKIDTEDPEPLLEFYKSYRAQGVAPTPNALSALHYASELAPQDLSLRMTSAMAYVRQGKLAEARSRLAPVAFNPHARGLADAARGIIALLDSGNAAAALRAGEARPLPERPEDQPN
jgi:Flp pilus assembly protein TadD